MDASSSIEHGDPSIGIGCTEACAGGKLDSNRASFRQGVMSAVGRVEEAIRRSVGPGTRLATPGEARPFKVADVNADGIVLLLGKGQWRTVVPWEALEGIPNLLRGRGWVRTTGTFAASNDVASLSGYLKQFVYRETANWVAVVLESAGVVQLDRTRPVRARLAPGF